MHDNSSPETVSIVLCQCSIMDSCKCRLFQISLRRVKLRPKRIQNALKTHIEATINLKFSRGRSPEPPLREWGYPLSYSPPLVPSALALTSAGPLLITWRRAWLGVRFLSQPGIHSRHAMTLCRRCAALKSVVRKRPFWFLWGAFSKKKRERFR